MTNDDPQARGRPNEAPTSDGSTPNGVLGAHPDRGAGPIPPGDGAATSPGGRPGPAAAQAPEAGIAGGTAVPRRAATVVVVRPAGTEVEILMLRRSAKSPFMPSTLVFPGGRLDAHDGAAEDPATWRRAAQRECREEAGVDLEGRALEWFDTWLTPSAEPRRRYHARFFLARLHAGEGAEAAADGHETEDERWATVREHLEAWEAESIDLPPPTLSILLRMSTWGGVEAVAERATEQDASGVILPKFVFDEGTPTIVMPHDPGYDALPGEGAPAPGRVHDFPRRFVRDGNRWRPC